MHIPIRPIGPIPIPGNSRVPNIQSLTVLRLVLFQSRNKIMQRVGSSRKEGNNYCKPVTIPYGIVTRWVYYCWLKLIEFERISCSGLHSRILKVRISSAACRIISLPTLPKETLRAIKWGKEKKRLYLAECCPPRCCAWHAYPKPAVTKEQNENICQ